MIMPLLCASAIIIYNAYRLFRPALFEIMDAAPSPEVIKKVIEASLKVNGVVAIDKCFARKMGFQYYIDMHVIVDGNISVHKGHEISHEVKDKLSRFFSKYFRCSYPYRTGNGGKIKEKAYY